MLSYYYPGSLTRWRIYATFLCVALRVSYGRTSCIRHAPLISNAASITIMCTSSIYEASSATSTVLVRMFHSIAYTIWNRLNVPHNNQNIMLSTYAISCRSWVDILKLFQIIISFNSIVKAVELVGYSTMREWNIWLHHHHR